jgi:hypothetical protein
MIKEFYLNLDRCTKKDKDMKRKFPNSLRVTAIDGSQKTEKSIKPFFTDGKWRDPYSGRKLTQGEVGCALSHIKAWKLCTVLEEPIIVLEDDVEVLDSDYQEKVSMYGKKYDFLYLGYKDMEGECEVIDNNLKLPKFTYWMCSYYITPKVAQALIDYYLNNPLIPTDEAAPAVLNIHRDKSLNMDNGFKVASFINPLMAPFEGAFDVSETEKSPSWTTHNFYIASCGDDESKMSKNLADIDINIGKGIKWEGGTMEGPGGGQKINLMKTYLETLDEEDIVMFIDGYDTFICSSKEDILERYLSFDCDIVFSAEVSCWPDKTLEDLHPESHTKFKYLNSGTYIGKVKALKNMFSTPIKNSEDDQLYCQKEFLKNIHNIKLDTESYIFFCLGGAEQDVEYRSSYIINTSTNCSTCVVHGNGGLYTKTEFDQLYNLWKGKSLVPLSFDILKISELFSKSWCKDLILACEEENSWKPLPNDKVPGQEIRLNELKDQSFKEYFHKVYHSIIVPQLEEYWPKLHLIGIRDLFVIKYDKAHQSSLPLHHDMSMVSAAIKLNKEYEGGLLNFPRQEIDNSSLDVGDGIFWPAQVTHPHESLPLESGVKYSLVLWTCRNDLETEYYGVNK